MATEILFELCGFSGNPSTASLEGLTPEKINLINSDPNLQLYINTVVEHYGRTPEQALQEILDYRNQWQNDGLTST